MTAAEFWGHFSGLPLFWLVLTLLLWLAANAASIACRRHPLVNPVLLTIAGLVAMLILTGTSYATFMTGAHYIHFLLGPATVALAIPLVRQWPAVKSAILPIVAALAIGSVTAAGSVILLGKLAGLSPDIITALAPKSTTTAVAVAISTSLGGNAALTAVCAIITGILGAIIVTPFMNAMKITDFAARGFAVGLASHGIGTARAYAVNATAGLFAGIAMALNAIITAVIVPWMLGWLG
jgi:predicted murein hydrolase (TIGR00659 family)